MLTTTSPGCVPFERPWPHSSNIASRRSLAIFRASLWSPQISAGCQHIFTRQTFYFDRHAICTLNWDRCIPRRGRKRGGRAVGKAGNTGQFWEGKWGRKCGQAATCVPLWCRTNAKIYHRATCHVCFPFRRLRSAAIFTIFTGKASDARQMQN